MRAVKCVVGSYGAVMEDTECNAATRPTDTQVILSSCSAFSHLLAVRATTLHGEHEDRISGRSLTLIPKTET